MTDVGSVLWAMKGLVQDSNSREMTVALHEQSASVAPFGQPDWRTAFTSDRIASESRIALHDAPRDKMLAVFDAMSDALTKPNYRGCAFVRATAEMPADASGRAVCVNARRWTRELLSRLAKEAGAPDPDALARQLLLLYDGAAAAAQMDHDAAAGAQAKAAAVLLIDAACAKR